MIKKPHPNTQIRELAMQFFYRCEIEKIYFYSNPHVAQFMEDQAVPEQMQDDLRELIKGIFENQAQVDDSLTENLQNWSLDRLTIIDRAILRICCYQAINHKAPMKVIINEGVELAKRYGSEDSGSFVNGVLDKIVRGISADPEA